MDTKEQLRKHFRTVLRNLDPETRARASREARVRLEQQPPWKSAQSIFFYAPLPEELDIWPLVQDALAQKKTACLPRFDEATQRYVACQVQDLTTDLALGRFKIREPAHRCVLVPLNRLDLILVPGVAFDTRGHRLGRGKGYYDQLLAQASGFRCGVAFDEQMIAEIPVESHDVSVDCILTPSRWIVP